MKRTSKNENTKGTLRLLQNDKSSLLRSDNTHVNPPGKFLGCSVWKI